LAAKRIHVLNDEIQETSTGKLGLIKVGLSTFSPHFPHIFGQLVLYKPFLNLKSEEFTLKIFGDGSFSNVFQQPRGDTSDLWEEVSSVQAELQQHHEMRRGQGTPKPLVSLLKIC